MARQLLEKELDFAGTFPALNLKGIEFADGAGWPVAPAGRMRLRYLHGGGAEISISTGAWAALGGGGGGAGNITGALNVGTEGVGFFDGLDGASEIINLRNAAPESDRISITLDDTDNNVLFDVVEAELDLAAIGGTLPRNKLAVDGGTEGEHLTLVSGVPTWTAAPTIASLSPLTTKGDLLTRNATQHVRVAVGTDGQVLMADAADPEGIKWSSLAFGDISGTLPIDRGGTGAITATTAFDNLAPASAATGAMITYQGGHWVKLDVGTNGQALVVASSMPTWTSLAFGDITGTLPINRGGTGQTTASAAFNALAPTTTNGDLIIRAGGVNARLGIGTDGQILSVSSGAPAWVTPDYRIWSNLIDPVDNLDLQHGEYSTTFTFGALANASSRFFLQDIGGNTGTGYLLDLRVHSSTLKPFRIRISNDSIIAVNANTGIIDFGKEIRLQGATSGYSGLKASATTTSVTYTLPAADGTSGYVLSTNGSGALSWVVQGGGVAGSVAWNAITNPTGNLALAMDARTTTFTHNNSTGAANLWTWTDSTTNGSATGYLVTIATTTGSTLKPFRVQGAGADVFEVWSTSVRTHKPVTMFATAGSLSDTVEQLTLSRVTPGGTPIEGYGSQIGFYANYTSTLATYQGYIKARWLNNPTDNQDAQLRFEVADGGAAVTVLDLSGLEVKAYRQTLVEVTTGSGGPTTAAANGITLSNVSTATPGYGFGMSITWRGDISSGGSQADQARIDAIWKDVGGDIAEDGALKFFIRANDAMAEVLELSTALTSYRPVDVRHQTSDGASATNLLTLYHTDTAHGSLEDSFGVSISFVATIPGPDIAEQGRITTHWHNADETGIEKWSTMQFWVKNDEDPFLILSLDQWDGAYLNAGLVVTDAFGIQPYDTALDAALGASGAKWGDIWAVDTHFGDVHMGHDKNDPGEWVLREGPDGVYAYDKRRGEYFRIEMKRVSEDQFPRKADEAPTGPVFGDDGERLAKRRKPARVGRERRERRERARA